MAVTQIQQAGRWRVEKVIGNARSFGIAIQLKRRLAGLNHLGSFRKNTFLICPPLDSETSCSLGKLMFLVLTGAIIWVRFEKRMQMIEGEGGKP